MKILTAIYDSPVKLLQKATRDGEALVLALSTCDESAVRDSLFNFAVSAYHLWDWVKAFRPDLKDKVSALLDSSSSLRACRDLCNASKHVALELTSAAYRNHPPVVVDVRVSATSATSMRNTTEESASVPHTAIEGVLPAPRPPWRLKIQMNDGHTIRAEALVSGVLGVWAQFFADNCIL